MICSPKMYSFYYFFGFLFSFYPAMFDCQFFLYQFVSKLFGDAKEREISCSIVKIIICHNAISHRPLNVNYVEVLKLSNTQCKHCLDQNNLNSLA